MRVAVEGNKKQNKNRNTLSRTELFEPSKMMNFHISPVESYIVYFKRAKFLGIKFTALLI
jgi:hypothetical protein